MRKTDLVLSVGICSVLASCGGGGGNGASSSTPVAQSVNNNAISSVATIVENVVSATNQQLSPTNPLSPVEKIEEAKTQKETTEERQKGTALTIEDKPTFNGEISTSGSSVTIPSKPIFDAALSEDTISEKGTPLTIEDKPIFNGELTTKGSGTTVADKPTFDGEISTKGSGTTLADKPIFDGEITTKGESASIEDKPVFKGDLKPAPDLITASEETHLDALTHSDRFTGTPHSIGIIDTAFTKDTQEVGNIFGNRLTIYKNTEFSGTATGNNWSHGTFVSAIIAQKNTNAPLYAYTSSNEENPDMIVVQGNSFKNAHNKGIRIFNLSLGTTNKQREPTAESVQSHFKIADFAKSDSIFVLAGGNERQAYSSNEAHAILKDEEMKNGWIVVAAVPDHSQSFELASYSNKIGSKLQNYGITAKGNWDLNFNGRKRTKEGTSFAAPLVTAVVGKIWDKFPWMDNHLVTMTLLSTASKPNKQNEVTQAPDDKFGWGILNEERALKGLARLDSKLMTAKDDKANNLVRVKFDHAPYAKEQLTWSNDIAGDAGLLKEGTGALYLTGSNSYLGDTVVRQGVLAVTNQLASNINIEPNGHLWTKNDAQAVEFGQNVANDGSLYVYGKELTIAGNYHASQNARLVIDIDTARLNVKGTMAMNGSRVVADIEHLDNVPSRQIQEKVIAQAAEISGYQDSQARLSNANKPYIELESIRQNGHQLVARYKRNDTVVALTHSGTTPTAVSRNTATNLDKVLDEAANQPDTSLRNATSMIVNAFSAELPQQVESLSGELHITSLNSLQQRHQALNRHLSQRLFLAKNTADLTAWADWQQGKNRLEKADFATMQATETGVRLGLEKSLEQGVVGFGVQSGKSDLRFSGLTGSADLAHKGGFVYGKYQPNAFYAATSLSYQQSRLESQRSVLNQLAKANYNIHQFNLYSELGYRLAWVTPFIGYEWQQFRHNGWLENVDLGVSADKQRHSLQTGLIGLHFEHLLNADFRLTGGLAQRYAIGSTDFSLNGQFNGSNQSARFIGINPARQQTWLNFGVDYRIKALSLFARYETALSNGTQKANHQIKVGGEYRFGK